jgi:hypothetical protein
MEPFFNEGAVEPHVEGDMTRPRRNLWGANMFEDILWGVLRHVIGACQDHAVGVAADMQCPRVGEMGGNL